MQETATYEEVITSPQAKRIQVTELVHAVSFTDARSPRLDRVIKQDPPHHFDDDFEAPSSDQDDMEAFAKVQIALRPTKPIIDAADLRQKSMPLYDSRTGLLTPPITPPTPDSSTMPSAETAYIAGADVVASADTLRRRIPGDHLMATFGDSSSNDKLLDP